jgi:hypothetical protein
MKHGIYTMDHSCKYHFEDIRLSRVHTVWWYGTVRIQIGEMKAFYESFSYVKYVANTHGFSCRIA